MGVSVLAEIWSGKDKNLKFFFFFFVCLNTRWICGNPIMETWRVTVVGWQWHHSKERISAVQMVVV
jgi:hypothetical protein